jgi:histidinol-phosphate aminotransferase
MQLSRRRFFQTSVVATAAAMAAPSELLFAEPQRAARPGGPILLNSNEYAYGPWPSALAAMKAAASQANRYPDSLYDSLLAKIGELHRVPSNQIITGCGSSEILRVMVEAFAGKNLPLITALPSYEAISNHARVRGAEVRQVPLTSTFAHDLEGMARAAKGEPALFFICNPNNPTASLTPRRDIEAFLAGLNPKSTVLIDEAYHHFAVGSADYTSFLDQPVANERVVVARTFSKIYGLAGIRLGYAVAKPHLIALMRGFSTFDNVNTLAAVCGIAGLNDLAGLAAALKQIRADSEEFSRQAQQRRIRLIPSHANFVMMETGKPIRELIGYFRQHNIAIGRPFPPLETYARISLGTPEEMRSFWQAWDAMKA